MKILYNITVYILLSKKKNVGIIIFPNPQFNSQVTNKNVHSHLVKVDLFIQQVRCDPFKNHLFSFGTKGEISYFKGLPQLSPKISIREINHETQQ